MMAQRGLLNLLLSLGLATSVWAQGVTPTHPVKPNGTALFPSAFASADNIAAQTATAMHGLTYIWDGANWDRWTGAVTGSGNFTVVQATGTNLHIVCDSGCSGSAGFADNAAFTFGTTTINPIGGVLDDTATNTATENSAAVARITAQKALHTNLRNNSGTEVGTSGSPLRIDPTGTTTQPISAASLPLPTGAATLAEQQTQTTALQKLDNIAHTNDAALSEAAAIGCQFDDTAPGTTTENNVRALRCSTRREAYILIRDAAGNERGANVNASNQLSVSVDNTPTVAIGQTTTQNDVDVVSLPNEGQQTAANSISVTPDTDNDAISATGAAPPGEATFVGGLSSGATGGFLQGIAVCDLFANVNVSTATTTLLVTGVSGRHVRICSINVVTAAANNVALISGTGATCGTGTTAMNGGTTAATGWNFAANGGLAQGSGIGMINSTNATGDSVCIVTSAATQLSGRIAYTIY